MNKDDRREPLDPKLALIAAYIECGERHRQTDGHRCRLHTLLDESEASR